MEPLSALRLDPATVQFCTAWLLLLLAGCAWSLAQGSAAQRGPLLDWARATGLGGCALLLAPLAQVDHIPEPLLPPLRAAAAALLLCLPALALRGYARLLSAPVRGRVLWALGVVGVAGVLLEEVPGAPHGLGGAAVAGASAPMLALLGLTLQHHGRQRDVLEPAPRGRLLLALLFGALAVALGIRAAQLPLLSHEEAGATQLVTLLTGAAAVSLATLGFFRLVQEQQRSENAERARRDALTGLYTRGAFMELAKAVQRSDRPYAALVLDVDRLREINERLGLAAGDLVLAHAARQIATSIRLSDLAARSGGEEFWVLLRDCSRAEAEQSAHRLVEQAARQMVRLGSHATGYTLSAGLAWHEGGLYEEETVDEVLTRATRALAQAKRDHPAATGA